MDKRYEQSTAKEWQIAYNHKEKYLVSFKIKAMQDESTLREVKLMVKREGETRVCDGLVVGVDV